MPSTCTVGYCRSQGSRARRIAFPRFTCVGVAGPDAQPWAPSVVRATRAASLARIRSVLRRDGHEAFGLEAVRPAVEAAVELDAREAGPCEQVAELAPGVHAKAEGERADLRAGDDGPLVAHERPVLT